MTDLGLAYVAGLLSVLAPCVLPLVPLILASAFQQHRAGPLALAAGMMVAYAGVGVAVASLGFAAGLDPRTLRIGAAVVMLVFGVVMLSAPLQARFATAGAAVSDGANGLLVRLTPDGLGGQFLIGALLGAVWAPCVGPTLGAAIGLATQSRDLVRATIIMAVFALGAVTPILALAYGSRQALMRRRDTLLGIGKWGKIAMGVVLVALGLVTLSGLDRIIEMHLTEAMPAWLLDLTTRY